MIPYRNFRYIYPPRPEIAVPPGDMMRYERDYIAQPKLNGDCLVVFTNGEETHLYNRHKKQFVKARDEHRFLEIHRETVDGTSRKWMALVGEYMTKGGKDERGENFNHNFVIFDILAYDQVQLVTSKVVERQQLLDRIYGTDSLEMRPDGVRELPFLYTTGVQGVYRAKNFMSDFDRVWSQLVEIDMYEGLVFKLAEGKLENGTSEHNNSAWQFKIRKPHKNYKY